MLEKYVTIFRAVNNFVFVGEDRKTPAMTAGVRQDPATVRGHRVAGREGATAETGWTEGEAVGCRANREWEKTDDRVKVIPQHDSIRGPKDPERRNNMATVNATPVERSSIVRLDVEKPRSIRHLFDMDSHALIHQRADHIIHLLAHVDNTHVVAVHR